MSAWAQIKRNYEAVKLRTVQRSSRSVAFYVLSSTLSAGFGGWASYLYQTVRKHSQDQCAHRLLSAILALAIVSFMSALAAVCICIHVRSAFRSFVEKTAEIVSHYEDTGNSDVSRPLIGDSKERKIKESDGKSLHWIDRLQHERVVAGTITDSIAMVCCACCYLTCSWIAVLTFVLYGLILSWTIDFTSNANCWLGSQSQLISLQLQLRIYFIVWLGSFACQILCFLHFANDTIVLYEIHKSQHQIIKHLDLKPSVFIVPPEHSLFASSSSLTSPSQTENAYRRN